jgi:hypothetical protein
MSVFRQPVEYALDVAADDADARELLWSVMFGNEQQRPTAACQSLASCSTFKKSP